MLIPAKPAARIDGLRLCRSRRPPRPHVVLFRKECARRYYFRRLLHNPDLILLDEPFSGLDVATSLVLRSLIEELAVRGKVVLFSSHELDTVERVSKHVVILHKGKLVADDSIASLRSLMSLPTLEEIFRQLAVEQNTTQVAAEIANLIEA